MFNLLPMIKKIYAIISVIAISFILYSFTSLSLKKSKFDYLITISTDFGQMKLLLFDDTPIHKANFIKLAQEGKYNGSIFHRVIPDFMIQGGAIKHDNNSWDTLSFDARTLENEIMDKHKHVYGALAAARVKNPEKRSDLSQFYIVVNPNGVHYLDNNYTVFGQLIVGFNVLDSIVSQKRDGSSPIKQIKMVVKAEKVKRSDIVRFYGDIY